MTYYDEHYHNNCCHPKKKEDWHGNKKRKNEADDVNVVVADQDNTNTTTQYAYAEATGGNAEANVIAAIIVAERFTNVAVGGDAEAVAVNRNKTCQSNNAQSGDDNDSKACVEVDEE